MASRSVKVKRSDWMLDIVLDGGGWWQRVVFANPLTCLTLIHHVFLRVKTP